MSRSNIFHQLRRTLRIAGFSDHNGLPSREGIEIIRARRATRRQFLAGAAGAVATAAGLQAAPKASLDVGIVGAGLAGLVAADQLRIKGTLAKVYEASNDPGGRCRSLRGFFPGQVAERGGELIDNLHKTMLGYAREFGLALEDLSKEPGDVAYYFHGRRYPESAVVDEYRAFVPAMRADLRRLSRQITADSYKPFDAELDNTSLAEYLNTRGAGPVIKAAIEAAYIAEYGLSTEEQSCLNFLLFIHADRRAKFQPFGVFSDERYHLIDGNDAIVQGLAGRLAPRIEYGRALVHVHTTPAGRVELTFSGGHTVTHDSVILALPFTILRDVTFDPALPAWKHYAISQLGYGTNTKTMVGFVARPWYLHVGSSGASYSDLENHQTT